MEAVWHISRPVPQKSQLSSLSQPNPSTTWVFTLMDVESFSGFSHNCRLTSNQHGRGGYLAFTRDYPEGWGYSNIRHKTHIVTCSSVLVGWADGITLQHSGMGRKRCWSPETMRMHSLTCREVFGECYQIVWAFLSELKCTFCSALNLKLGLSVHSLRSGPVRAHCQDGCRVARLA